MIFHKSYNKNANKNDYIFLIEIETRFEINFIPKRGAKYGKHILASNGKILDISGPRNLYSRFIEDICRAIE